MWCSFKISALISAEFRDGVLGAIAPSPKTVCDFFQQKALKNPRSATALTLTLKDHLTHTSLQNTRKRKKNECELTISIWYS